MGSRRTHSTRRLTAPAPKRSARRKPARKPPPTSRSRPYVPDELHRQLAQIGHWLEVLYATCVTVGLALKQQNGDEDEEIARCLMRNVADPLNDQAEVLEEIVRRLERRRTAGQPVQS